MDRDNTEQIDPKEIRRLLSICGYDIHSDTTIPEMIAVLTKDHEGSISFDQFLGLMDAPETISRKEVAQVFSELDDNKSGSIGIKAVKKLCKDLGAVLSPEEMKVQHFRTSLGTIYLVESNCS